MMLTEMQNKRCYLVTAYTDIISPISSIDNKIPMLSNVTF